MAAGRIIGRATLAAPTHLTQRHRQTDSIATKHSSVLELRKNQFLKKINVLKTFLEIETTHYLEGLDLKLNNETYAKVPNL